MFKRIGTAAGVVAFLASSSPAAFATTWLDVCGCTDAGNYFALSAGNYTFNNPGSPVTGSIGDAGTYTDSGPAVTVTGALNLSGSTGPTNPTSGGVTYSGGVHTSVTAVTTDLSALSTLSANAAALTAGPGVTVTNSYTLTGNSTGTGAASVSLVAGTNVYNVTSLSGFNAGNKFTITGTSSELVVFNIPLSVSLNASIVLSGGITAADVLWNITGAHNLTISANNGNAGFPPTNTTAEFGIYLDPTGNISLDNSEINGLIAGGSAGFSVVSGAEGTDIGTTTPLPGALPLFASGLGIVGLLVSRRKRRKVASIARV